MKRLNGIVSTTSSATKKHENSYKMIARMPMLFYKALLVVLVSTAVVSALPGLGGGLLNGLTGQLHSAAQIRNLGELIQLLLGQLKDIKSKLPIVDIHNVIKDDKDTASAAASGVVDGASAVIPEPLSGVVNEIKGTASGVVGTASGVVSGPVSDALNEIKDTASGAVDNAANMIPPPASDVVDMIQNAASDAAGGVIDAAVDAASD